MKPLQIFYDCDENTDLFFQSSEDDVSQFDTKFTRLTPVDSPDESMLSESANRVFNVRTKIKIAKNCLF